MIKTPSDITCSKLEVGPMKVLDSGAKSINLRYEGRNLMVETPSLKLPYGVNVFDKNGPPKYSVDFSFGGADEDEKTRELQDFFEAFDEHMIDVGVEKAKEWFKMAGASREVVKAFYTPMVKISRDAAGNPKPYPPTFKVSVRPRRLKPGQKESDLPAASDALGRFETDFYNGCAKPLVAFPKEQSISEVVVKRSQVTAIIQCTGIWVAPGKYGTTWKAVQVRVDSQPDRIQGPAFRSEAPDIRAFVSRGLSKAAPVADSELDEEDEEEAEAEVVAAVKKPAAKPAFVEEEDVTEPVPLPTKKKVAPTKKVGGK